MDRQSPGTETGPHVDAGLKLRAAVFDPIVPALGGTATELMVLSACQTGLGDVQVGEGVSGPRRAFILAGARTLVMSLWNVPDTETRELIIDFSRYLLAGEGRNKAPRKASWR